MRARVAAALLLVVTQAACEASPPTAPNPAQAVPDPSPTTSPTATPTSDDTTPEADHEIEVRRRQLVLPVAGELPSEWRLQALLPYGQAEEELGVADDHGGAATPWGPEFGAPDRDGNWWLLDSNKRRIARYDADGHYLGQIPIPGRYVGVQLPFVLGADTFVAAGTPDNGLLTTDGVAVRFAVPRREQLRSWSYSDGTSVFSDDGRSIHTFTVVDGEPVWGVADSLLTPDGRPFGIRVDPGARGVIHVELPDAEPAPLRLEMAVLAAEPADTPVWPLIEFTADSNGRIHLLLIGHAEPGPQLAGYTTIEPDGRVAPLEVVRDPFGASDPGSPAHLRHVPGTEQVALMFVDDDGVRIYTRSY